MLDKTWYVPLLRWKYAERSALRDLFPAYKRKLRPLIEIPDNQRFDVSILAKYPRSIEKHWGREPIYFDFGPFSSDIRGKSLEDFFTAAFNRDLSLIPTTGLNRSAEYQGGIAASLDRSKNGLCLRLVREDLTRPDLKASIASLLKTLQQIEANVDLIIDLKLFMDSDLVIADVLSAVPNVMRWRSLVLVAGSFPKDLMGLKPGEFQFSRLEWLAWMTALTKHNLQRTPTFGDYTIVHPYLTQRINGIMNPSASIRYTAWDYWVVMRGQGLFTPGSAGHAQYPANAEMLSIRPEFSGAGFSAGDQYIFKIAEKKESTGNPTTWLQAGINHHLVFTISQLQKLFGKTLQREI
jgi:hypothetical protein